MRLLLLVLMVLLISQEILGQDVAMVEKSAKEVSKVVELKLNETNELYLNEVLLNENISTDKLVEMLGEPTITRTYPGKKDVSYYYEKHGIVFFVLENIVVGMGINYVWSGDEVFTKNSFTGKLQLGDLIVHKAISYESLKYNKKVEFFCPKPMLCMSNDNEAPIKSMISFEAGQLKQLMIMIN